MPFIEATSLLVRNQPPIKTTKKGPYVQPTKMAVANRSWLDRSNSGCKYHCEISFIWLQPLYSRTGTQSNMVRNGDRGTRQNANAYSLTISQQEIKESSSSSGPKAPRAFITETSGCSSTSLGRGMSCLRKRTWQSTVVITSVSKSFWSCCAKSTQRKITKDISLKKLTLQSLTLSNCSNHSQKKTDLSTGSPNRCRTYLVNGNQRIPSQKK